MCAALLCAECTDLSPSAQAPARHLSWTGLQSALPAVPRILLGHLGEEARRQIPRGGRVRVCDDLDSIEL